MYENLKVMQKPGGVLKMTPLPIRAKVNGAGELNLVHPNKMQGIAPRRTDMIAINRSLHEHLDQCRQIRKLRKAGRIQRRKPINLSRLSQSTHIIWQWVQRCQ